MIDFKRKIRVLRPHSRIENEPAEAYDIIRVFESDRGRIINSAAIRRLQQKTQVFPLERNAAVRSRLTHSLEVQQVGRHIAKEILYALQRSGKLEEYGLERLCVPFESMVEMACLMHDIGNPPFGHFGESAINDWFFSKLDLDFYESKDKKREDKCEIFCLKTCVDNDNLNTLTEKIRRDLSNFEGNAQAIRLVHTLLQLNLTYSQTACILKYTRPAYFPKPEKGSAYCYLMKKTGYYLAEAGYIADLRRELDIDDNHRFPLTYIMEAADDISYCIADLEDAVEKKIFTVERLYQCLKEQWGDVRTDDLFDYVVNRAKTKASRKHDVQINKDQFFMMLRVYTIEKLVPFATQRFLDNLEAIFEGSLNQSLLEFKNSEAVKLLDIYKTVAKDHVFNQREVERLELQGYRVINGLLDIYGKLLNIPRCAFSQLVEDNMHKSYPIETRLYHRLSTKHRRAYRDAVDETSKKTLTPEELDAWEFYYRARLIQDYISGMTDLYAYDEYRSLMAAE